MARVAPASQNDCISQRCGDTGTALQHPFTSARGLSVCAVKVLPRETHRKVPWHGSCIWMGRVQPLPTHPTLQHSINRKKEKYQQYQQTENSYICRKIRLPNLSDWSLNKLDTRSFCCFIIHDAVPQLDLPALILRDMKWLKSVLPLCPCPERLMPRS